MSIVLDTGAVIAILDDDDRHHQRAMGWLAGVDEDLITTPLALAEMDHFAHKMGGHDAASVLWQDFEAGAYAVRWWADALGQTINIARRYPWLDLADASLVALAGVLRTDRIATFDQHFRSLTTPDGGPFVLLPADA
ncbi:MAG TPA: PIN domain-containing protein [Solirubrobacteraceae bacterium]